jgi:DNA-binding transcriptional LysR family regulator
MSKSHPVLHRNVDYFIETARIQNITEAARRLGMTQTSLTLAIQSLEEALGFEVFHRDRRGVRLTDRGQKLYKGLIKIHSIADELMGAVSMPKEQACIKIGAVEHIGSDYLFHILKREKKLFPRFQLYMTYSKNVYDAVEQKKIDVGFIAWTSRPKFLSYIPVADEPLATVGLRSRFASISTARKAEELNAYPWVQLPKPQLDWTQLFSKDEEAYMVGGLYALRAAILSGMGIGEVHLRIFSAAEKKKLAIAPIPSAFSGTKIYCVYRPDINEEDLKRVVKLAHLLKQAL